MQTFYHCPYCRLTFTRSEVHEEVDYVTSEAWGERQTDRYTYLICCDCGGEVEETIAPEFDLEKEDEDENS